MAWLFFIDESGHDHKNTPYEVRGGFAIHVSKLWSFVQDMQRLEVESFGCQLHEYKKELKGSTLIDRKRFKFANQSEPFRDRDRQKLCRAFLAKGLIGSVPHRDEFTAYGQACLRMAQEIFGLLKRYEAVLLASVIPRGVAKPPFYKYDDYLRKDIVFLLERFFYFLGEKQEHGILVMDETEKREDQKFVARIERYFTKTTAGQSRTEWIVPTPLFVSSDMTAAVQAADVCIYCVNWGFRLPRRGMNAEHREEIEGMFEGNLKSLQFRNRRYEGGREYIAYGIVYVPDPYKSRTIP